MDGRYEVFATHGKGVFSTVLRARDQQCGSGPSEVAIKIIRANETMSKAAQTEKVQPCATIAQLQAAWLPTHLQSCTELIYYVMFLHLRFQALYEASLRVDLLGQTHIHTCISSTRWGCRPGLLHSRLLLFLRVVQNNVRSKPLCLFTQALLKGLALAGTLALYAIPL